jgi:PAP2 superfamily
MIFSRYERFVLTVVAALGAIDLILIAAKGIRVDWSGYGMLSLIGLGTIMLGLFYRHVRRDARISETLILTAGFILFTLVGSVFNYMLLPIHFPRVDDFWVSVDQLMGYHWPSLVLFFSERPGISALLKIVYFSSLPQLVVVVLLLGFTGQSRKLAHFLVTGMIGALLCMVVWALFPSFGASAVSTLPANVEAKLGLPVGPTYAAELVRLSKDGVDYLSPANVLGLIGFPSFHTVMAVMSVVFTWQIVWLRLPVLAPNMLMVPALLLHGGHHLSDFLGGLVVFAVACLAARYVINALRDDKAASAPAEHVRVAP